MNAKKAGRTEPLILEIKGNSLDDGPGIRSVVFFKGCPLSCVWCHNPESKKPAQELSFDPMLCAGCNTCVQRCAQKALSKKNPGFIDRKKCSLCYDCADACPSKALARVGERLSIEEITAKLAKDRPFYKTSGGGVTLSGGEPMLFPDFAARLLATLKKKGIHTLLETCGLFDFDIFKRLVFPHLDAVYFDIKLFDSGEHRKYCGAANERILANFEKVREMAARAKKIFLPRTPLVPGITDTESNMRAIAGFLKSRGITRAALLPYNPLWHEKSDKIGVDDPHRSDADMTTWQDKESLRRCREIFHAAGIET